MADETKIIKIEIDTSGVDEAAVSIKSLTDANKKLREERRNLDITTENGRKQIDLINQSLDRNDKLIKQNSSSLEKQRLNVGNYTQSIQQALKPLDQMTGGAASAAQGIVSMTTSSKAFIATPIGAVLGVIGVAVAALTEYFKGSEEGQNRWNKIAAVGNVIMERFRDVLEYIGRILVEGPEKMDKWSTALKIAFFPVTAIIANVKMLAAAFERFFPETAASISKFFNDVSADAQKLSDLEIAITQKHRALVEESAKTGLEVSELRRKADEASGQARITYIEQAIAAEQRLGQEQLKLAQLEQQLAQAKLDINGADIAAKDALAAANAKVYEVQQAVFDNTRKNNKELIALRQQQITDEAAARAQETADKVAQQQTEDQQMAELRAADGQDKIENEGLTADAQIEMSKAVLEQRKQDVDTFDVIQYQSAQKQLEIDKLKQQAMYQGTAQVLHSVAGLFKKNTLAYKVIATAETTASTASAAMGAYKSASEIPYVGWLLGPIAAAAAVAAGALQIATINGIQFATGGYTGMGGKYEPKGVVHGNEYVIPSETVNRYGPAYFDRYMPGYADGGLVVAGATAAANEQYALQNALRNQPPIYTSWKEEQLMTDRVQFKENLRSR